MNVNEFECPFLRYPGLTLLSTGIYALQIYLTRYDKWVPCQSISLKMKKTQNLKLKNNFLLYHSFFQWFFTVLLYVFLDINWFSYRKPLIWKKFQWRNTLILLISILAIPGFVQISSRNARRAWFYSINIQIIKPGLLSISKNYLVIFRQVTK